MLDRLKVTLAKRETSYGVDAVPVAATDALLLKSVTPTPLEVDYVDRELVRPFMGKFEQLPARSRVRMEHELELAGFGTAGPATPTPGYAALLRSCGLGQTINAGTDVQYKPVSSGHDSMSEYFYADGRLHKMLGARGNLEIAMPLNDRPMFRTSHTGLYGGVSDLALPSPTVSAYQRPVLVNQANTTALNIHGLLTAKMKNLTINLNNNIVHRNLVGGAEEILITDRLVSGEIEIEDTLVAVKDWWTIIRNATLGVFSVTHGPATNRVKIDGANVQLTNPRMTQEDRVMHLTLGLEFLPSSAGNDEITISVL